VVIRTVISLHRSQSPLVAFIDQKIDIPKVATLTEGFETETIQRPPTIAGRRRGVTHEWPAAEPEKVDILESLATPVPKTQTGLCPCDHVACLTTLR
jgi:hypothetical protein